MKKRFLITTLLLIIPYVFILGQNKVSYTYDSNGNRISRTLVVIQLKSGKDANNPDAADSLKTEIATEKSIKIFPNPVKSTLNIEIVGYDDTDKKTAAIYSMSGEKLLQENSISPSGPMDLQNLNDGVYILIITVGDEVTRFKIIKNK